ncbi:MAG: GTPase HflX [Xanthobacteraceae bacterium]
MEPRRKSVADAPSKESGGAVGRAIVIGPYLRERASLARAGEASSRSLEAVRSPQARLDEAIGLALAIDLDVVDSGLVTLSAIRPATYIGKGKVDEIAGLVRTFEAGLVVMDCALSPVQQRNLEKAWNAKVLDRTGLILEIFGRRARTREGSLQVELAHLIYQRSRLVRSWTHLERQRGGFGFLGGPGETQIETDRRLIGERIARIKVELEGVKRTRHLHRESRKRVPYPIVALVGYTNAGKSTLFNRLTDATVLSADMLFATLDPTLRAINLPHGARVILSDTVGFISDLPTMLVAAFRATLEEVIEANLILHVRDVSHSDTEAQSGDVDTVLKELGIDLSAGTVIEVWNKADLLSVADKERVSNLAQRKWPQPLLVSALTGEGIDALKDMIEARIAETRTTFEVSVDAADGAGASWLYRNAEVLQKTVSDDGHLAMTVRVDPTKAGVITAKFGKARVTDVTDLHAGREVARR